MLVIMEKKKYYLIFNLKKNTWSNGDFSIATIVNRTVKCG